MRRFAMTSDPEKPMKKDIKVKSAIGTLTFVTIFALIFLLMKLPQIMPKEEEKPVVVLDLSEFGEIGGDLDYGNSEQGQGEGNNGDPLAGEKPNNTPEQSAQQPQPTKSQPVKSSAPKILTNNNTDNSYAIKQAQIKAQKEAEAKAKAAAELKAKQDAFQAKMNAGIKPGKSGVSGGGNDPSQGNNGGNGDFGKPDGQIGGTSLEPGKGSGDGFGYSLAGRKLIKKPVIVDDSQETGTIAVKIKVDKYGNVVFAEFSSKGSNTASTVLKNKAIKAAKEAKFDANANAAEEQWGTITITFKF